MCIKEKTGYHVVVFVAVLLLLPLAFIETGTAGQGEAKWTFALINDLHVGCHYPDYAMGGYNGDLPGESFDGDEYYLVKRLRQTVQWINNNKDEKNIRFVAVLGDLTDSAEESEFRVAKRELDNLEVPCIPVFGNHDIWSFTDYTSEELPTGRAAFDSVFADNFLSLANSPVMSSWEKDPSGYENYAFTIGGMHFLALDFVAEYGLNDIGQDLYKSLLEDIFPNASWFAKQEMISTLAQLQSKGVVPWAVAHDDTVQWLKSRLDSWGDDPVVLLAHHPLAEMDAGNVYSLIMTFFSDDWEEVESALNGHNIKAIFGGHVHSAAESPIGTVLDDFNHVTYPSVNGAPVVVTESLAAGSNSVDAKGWIRLAEVENGTVTGYSTVEGTEITEGAITPALNPYFDWSRGDSQTEVHLIPHKFSERPVEYKWDFNGVETGWEDFDDNVESVDFLYNFGRLYSYYDVTLSFRDKSYPQVVESITERITLDSQKWRQYIEPGDILLSRTDDGLASSGYWYTHTGIYIGDGKVAETRPESEGGVALYPIEDWDYPDKYYVSVVRVRTASPEQRQAAAQWAVAQTARSPKPGHSSLYLTRNADQSSNSWYCSELVWAAYYGGFDRDPGIPGNQGVDLACFDYFGDAISLEPVMPDHLATDDDVRPTGGHQESEPGSQTPSTDLTVEAEGPVDLSLVDPEGTLIDKNDDENYVEENGGNKDTITIPERKAGDYKVSVSPAQGAAEGDIYNLNITGANRIINAAQDVRTGNVLSLAYLVRSSEDDIRLIPQISSMDPASANVGEKVVINGLSFGRSQADSSVYFDKKRADCVSWSDNRIECKVPVMPSGNLQVAVETGEGVSSGASFTVLPFIIEATAGEGGEITPSEKVPVEYGADITFEVKPDRGYYIKDVVVDGESQGDIDSFTFKEVRGNHSLESTFERWPVYSIDPPLLGDKYYFAEGTCRPGFDSYLCIQNPGENETDVNITYMLGDGTSETQDVKVPGSSRVTVSVKDKLGEADDTAHDFSAKVQSTDNRLIVVERPMYFNYKGIWTGGHDVIGEMYPKNKYYFAEGTSRPGFDTYFCIQNPNEDDVKVKLTYMLGDGKTREQAVDVKAASRCTVPVKDFLGEGDDVSHDFSCVVESTGCVVVERPMYFNYKGVWTGGHDVVGIDHPSSNYYFAEGTCRPGFDPYLCIQNPEDYDCGVTITYQLGDGTSRERTVGVPAKSRSTVVVKDTLGEGDDVSHDFSCVVESSGHVIVERPMYFNYKGVWTGGHDVVGIDHPSSNYYFAEGTCRPGFDPYLCVQNPGDSEATVEIMYMLGNGETRDVVMTIPERSRYTVVVKDTLGEADDSSHDFSARVKERDGRRIIVERPMYFNYKGIWTGGHNVMGANI